MLRHAESAYQRSGSDAALALPEQEQGVEVVLRHACGALAMGLRQLVNRRIADAVHEPGLEIVAPKQACGK